MVHVLCQVVFISNYYADFFVVHKLVISEKNQAKTIIFHFLCCMSLTYSAETLLFERKRHLCSNFSSAYFLFCSRCHIRVIDTFGTEPAYNHEEYATLHGHRTNWGYWNLHSQQYMTMFRTLPLNSLCSVDVCLLVGAWSACGHVHAWVRVPGRWCKLIKSSGHNR